VTVDEASSIIMRFSNGASGLVDLARVAAQSGCDLKIEANGTKGSLAFDYSRLNELRFGTVEDDPRLYGMRTIRAEHVSHPYAAHWWPIGQGVGYGSSFVNQVADLLRNWPDGPWEPGFAQGARVQAVCEAAERSAETGAWVSVSGIG
jgi:predicted dehydrogenase